MLIEEKFKNITLNQKEWYETKTRTISGKLHTDGKVVVARRERMNASISMQPKKFYSRMQTDRKTFAPTSINWVIFGQNFLETSSMSFLGFDVFLIGFHTLRLLPPMPLVLMEYLHRTITLHHTKVMVSCYRCNDTKPPTSFRWFLRNNSSNASQQ